MTFPKQVDFSGWVCPKCKGDLKIEDGGSSCEPCGKRFNNVLGFPDFRLRYEDSKNQMVLARTFRENWDKLTYEDMVRLRFSGLRQRALARGKSPADFKMWDIDEQAHLATYKTRGGRHLSVLKSRLQQQDSSVDIGHLVDVGCGWGRDLLHLACLAKEAIGLDVSVFSLLITKKLLEEQGIVNATLVLAEAESLPLRPGCIDGINCSGAIEHMRIPGDFLRECSRCLGESAWVFLFYPNRFSVLPESHTGIWGLGYFSTARQKKIVLNRLGSEWETFLFSRRGFLRLLKSTCKYKKVSITGIPPGVEDFLSTSKFSLMFPHMYSVAKHILPAFRLAPGLERLVSFFCPVHFVLISR